MVAFSYRWPPRKNQAFHLVTFHFLVILCAVSKAKKKDQIDLQSLNHFFQSPLAERAAKGLSDTVCIALTIEEETFYFVRKNGQNALVRQEPTRPDVQFWLSQNAMRQIFQRADDPQASLASVGLAIFEGIFSKTPEDKIRFRVNASFLSLFRKGYFSVLKAGGPEVASYLTRWGFSLTKIKEVLRNSRG